MYKYSDTNDDHFSLHDCRATGFSYENGEFTFTFDEGFYVSEDNPVNSSGKWMYTNRSEIVFKPNSNDMDFNISVSVFTDTGEKNKSIREFISLEEFADMIHNGAELEFLSAYKGYRSYLFDCWLWFDTEPHHKECTVYISAENITYYWNDAYPEE